MTTSTAIAPEFSVTTPETRKRNLSYFDKEIYVFSLTINKGGVDKTLSLDLLGLDEDQKKAIAKSNGSRVTFRPVKVRAFESINEAAASLQSSREDIQEKMIFSGEYWFAQAANMPDIHNICYGSYIRRRGRIAQNRRETMERLGIITNDVSDYEVAEAKVRGKGANYERVLGIFQQIPIWKQYISESFYEDKEKAISDLQEVLATIEGMSYTDRDAIVQKLEDSLPSREAVSEQIGAKIGICVRIPSLKEQAQEDAELARSLADRESAEVSLRETRMARQLQDEYANNIRNSFSTAMEVAENEVYALITDSLSRMSDYASGHNLTETTKQKLLENIARLDTLATFGDQTAPLTELVSTITEVSQSAVQRQVTRSTLQTLIGEIRAQLNQEVDTHKVTGKGHKAIAQWMFE